MENQEEVWKTIGDYKDYQASNLGRIKSLKLGKERILKSGLSTGGYRVVIIHHNKKRYAKKVHQLIAIAFLNHIPCGHKSVVNHKDFNRVNNNLNNLEIITHRENGNKKHLKSSSKYTGVSWCTKYGKWESRITINKKLKFLGYFHNETDAHNAYQNKLKEINKSTLNQ